MKIKLFGKTIPLFARTAPCWMFWVSLVYLIAGFVQVFFIKNDASILLGLQMIYCVVLALPIAISPLGRFFHIKSIWSQLK